MTLLETTSTLLFFLGIFFFFAGSLGLLRFPDLVSRLHALTKADNVGLACICMAVAINTNNLFISIKIIFIWLIVLVSSSLLSCLIAQRINKTVTQNSQRS